MELKVRNGFSLLELLISVSVLAIIFGFSVSSYTQFNRKEQVRQAALTFKSDLRFAQSRAVSAEKPQSGCTTYNGVLVTYGTSTYVIQPTCLPQGVAGTAVTKTLPSSVTFSAASSIKFNALTKTVNINTPTTIGVTNGTSTYQFQVFPSGDIADIGFI